MTTDESPLDRLLTGYIEAALFSSNDNSRDDGGDPLDENYSRENLSPALLASMRADCKAFLDAHSALIAEPGAYVGESASKPDFDVFAYAGHDFWLNRNGHGCGFWDGDWNDAISPRLDEAAKAFGEVNLYVGDNGEIDGE